MRLVAWAHTPRRPRATRLPTRRPATARGSRPPWTTGGAFGALAGRDLACRVSLAPLARVDIRQHIVAERHHRGIGLGVQAPHRGVLGALEVVGVEQGPGEIQITGAEARVPVHGRTKMRHGIGGPAVAREELRHVEMSLIQFWSDRYLDIESGQGIPPLPTRLVEQPEVVMGHRLIRLESDRLEQ